MTVAIDVALLLGTKAKALATSLNKRTVPAGPDGFRFDAHHLPHVTLGQHFVKESALDAIGAALAALAGTASKVALHVTGIERGRTAQVLTIASTAPLDALHTAVMEVMHPFEVNEGDAAAFATGPAARPADVAWVRDFRTAAAYERFHPHITIGIGGPPLAAVPFRAHPDRMGVCRLGRFCTCGKPIAAWTLGT
ncbi:MAG: hypothetical protein CL483_00165 [Acidobacteria bacterium]|nr:hypothetical protein [Acidobacteriota bacterium]